MGKNNILVHNTCPPDEEGQTPKKEPPNPDGRKGGAAHQQKTNEIIDEIKQREKAYPQKKIEVGTEKMFLIDDEGYIPHKSRRFADVVEYQNGDISAIYQVGKVNKNGLPVSREAKAIEDIMHSSQYKGVPIYFIPYNSDIGPIIYMK